MSKNKYFLNSLIVDSCIVVNHVKFGLKVYVSNIMLPKLDLIIDYKTGVRLPQR